VETVDPPAGLQWVLSVVAGSHWPQGREGDLWDLGTAHHTAAQEIAAASAGVSGIAGGAQESMTGPGGAAMAGFVGQVGGNLPSLEESARGLGDLAQETATEIQYAKFMIIATAVWLLTELAALLPWSWVPGVDGLIASVEQAARVIGLSAVRRMAANVAARMTAAEALKGLLAEAGNEVARLLGELGGDESTARSLNGAAATVAEGAAHGALVSTGLDVGVQSVQMLAGDRTSWDWSSTLASAEEGALAGATGAAVSEGLTGAATAAGRAWAERTGADEAETVSRFQEFAAPRRRDASTEGEPWRQTDLASWWGSQTTLTSLPARLVSAEAASVVAAESQGGQGLELGLLGGLVGASLVRVPEVKDVSSEADLDSGVTVGADSVVGPAARAVGLPGFETKLIPPPIRTESSGAAGVPDSTALAGFGSHDQFDSTGQDDDPSAEHAKAKYLDAVTERNSAERAHRQLLDRVAGAGGSRDPGRLGETRARLAEASKRVDDAKEQLTAAGIGELAGRDDRGPGVLESRARELLGRPRPVIGGPGDDEAAALREKQQQALARVTSALAEGGEAKAKRLAAELSGPSGFRRDGLPGGAVAVNGVNFTQAFQNDAHVIQEQVRQEIEPGVRPLLQTQEQIRLALARLGQAHGVLAANQRADLTYRYQLVQREIERLGSERDQRIAARQRELLMAYVQNFRVQMEMEYAAPPAGARPFNGLEREHLQELDGEQKIDKQLARLIVEPTGHRGYHPVLNRDVGRHPEFGAKVRNIKVNNFTDFLRGTVGWIDAKDNRKDEKALATLVDQSRDVNRLINALLVRTNRFIDTRANARFIRAELASGVNLRDRTELGGYLHYFRTADVPAHLKPVDPRWAQGMLGVLRQPNAFFLREKMMVLHDLMEYFGSARRTSATFGTGVLQEEPGHFLSTRAIDAQGRRTAVTPDRGQNPVGIRPNGEIERHPSTRNENSATTMLARERQIPVWAGQSFTAARMYLLAKTVGGTTHEIGAVAWGIFAFWRLHFDHTTPLAYHTLHETMDTAQNFGVPYSLSNREATLSQISVHSVASDAQEMASFLENFMDIDGGAGQVHGYPLTKRQQSALYVRDAINRVDAVWDRPEEPSAVIELLDRYYLVREAVLAGYVTPELDMALARYAGAAFT